MNLFGWLKRKPKPRQLVSMPGYERWSDGSGKLGLAAGDQVTIHDGELTLSGEVIRAGAVGARLLGPFLIDGLVDVQWLPDSECAFCGSHWPAGTHKCPTCGAAIPQKVVSP